MIVNMRGAVVRAHVRGFRLHVPSIEESFDPRDTGVLEIVEATDEELDALYSVGFSWLVLDGADAES